MLRRFIKTRIGITAVSAFLLVAVSVTVAAAGVIVDYKPVPFAATFDARAVGDPSIEACRGFGAAGQKFEGQYQGTMTIDGEEFAFNFTTLEILFDRATGVGTAEGHWQLADARSETVGRGELVAVVTAGDPPGEGDPPSELQLRGLLIGSLEPPDPDLEPPDPDLPAQRLIGNFTATLGDGATFPHLKGTVGDPSVGDPSVGDPSAPAVLVPAVKC
jgi:hypothetical protein